jgi:hypothetical protein
MASDWLKMRIDLQSHPKVVRILSATKSDKFRVIGGLHAVWAVFDTHSVDGRLTGYTPELMDHVIGWNGFSAAMMAVGWLGMDGPETLVIPEFTTHNGQSGKRRAEDQKRKKESRSCPQSVRNSSANEADKLPEESGPEREREKKKKRTPVVPASGDVVDAVLTAYHEVLPNCRHHWTVTPSLERRIRKVNAMAMDVAKRQGWDMGPADFWNAYFGECQNDPWLRGDLPNPNNPKWKQHLACLIDDDRFQSIMDIAIDRIRNDRDIAA